MAAGAPSDADAWGEPLAEAPQPPPPAAAAPAPPRRSSSGGNGTKPQVVTSMADAKRLRPLLDLKLSPAPPPPTAVSHRRSRASSTGSSSHDKTGSCPFQIPTLQSLALGVVARHVSELVAALGPAGCAWLPTEAKASLLAAARRRGELTDSALLALADGGFKSLDISGTRVCGAALLEALERMPGLVALDVSRCERVSAGALVRLARRCPALALLRLGGGGEAGAAAAGALARILPAIAPELVVDEDQGEGIVTGSSGGGGGGGGVAGLATTGIQGLSISGGVGSSAAAAAATAGGVEQSAAADSWEDLLDEEQPPTIEPTTSSSTQQHDTGGSSGRDAAAAHSPSSPSQQQDHKTRRRSSSGGGFAPCGGSSSRLWQLKAIVWPDCPRDSELLLQRLCPRVVLNPCPRLRPGGALLAALPREVDPDVPLDLAAFEAVGPAALEVGARACLVMCPCLPVFAVVASACIDPIPTSPSSPSKNKPGNRTS
jgi:hypothetical protein